MKIKTENGEVNVASQGQSTLNTVLGAVGTAGSMGLLSGLIGGNRNQLDDVTKYVVPITSIDPVPTTATTQTTTPTQQGQ